MAVRVTISAASIELRALEKRHQDCQESLPLSLFVDDRASGQHREPAPEGFLRIELTDVSHDSQQRKLQCFARRFLATDKRDADREVPLPGLAGGSVHLADGQSSPSHKAGREEQAAAVRQALARLPEHYREVLVWREWDELPFAEIAQRLGKTADAARMLWWRAVERFNEEMNSPP